MTVLPSTGKTTMSPKIQPNGLQKSAELQLLARDFAFHCSALRTRLHMNQTQFASLLGITNKVGKITVSRWESGTHTPQKKYLLKFMALQNKHDRRK